LAPDEPTLVKRFELVDHLNELGLDWSSLDSLLVAAATAAAPASGTILLEFPDELTRVKRFEEPDLLSELNLEDS